MNGGVVDLANAGFIEHWEGANMSTETPRTDHVMQHGLAYTGKDELAWLCRQLERDYSTLLRIAVRLAEYVKVQREGVKKGVTTPEGLIKLVRDAFEAAEQVLAIKEKP